jgi:hypothetical protein
MTDHTAPQLSDGELWELIHKDFPFACDRWEPLLNFDQIKTVIRRALAAAPGTAEAQPATPQEAPPADGGAQKEWRIQQLAKLLQSALRIPAMPFPDPGAHSWQAYAQAVHAAYCAVRFKVINAIADLEKIAQPAQPAVDAARPAAQALSREHRELMLLAAADLESWMTAHGRDGTTEDTITQLREAAIPAEGLAIAGVKTVDGAKP